MALRVNRRAWIRSIIYSGLGIAGSAGYICSNKNDKVEVYPHLRKEFVLTGEFLELIATVNKTNEP